MSGVKNYLLYLVCVCALFLFLFLSVKLFEEKTNIPSMKVFAQVKDYQNKNIKDKEKLRILYRLMTNNNSLRGSHHQKDVTIISECEDFDTRLLLLKIATCWDNINSINHEFDMDFISRLDVSMFDDEQLKEIYYYLFNPNGINHLEHIFMLERLKAGEIIKESDMVKKDSNDKGNFGFKRFFKNIYKN